MFSTPRFALHLAAVMLAAGLVSPAAADTVGSATSSASSAGSASIGSLSDSIGGSSNSSAGDKKVADGEYRVIEVAAAPDKPGHVQLRLRAAGQAHSDAQDVMLRVPDKAVQPRGVAVGDVVRATNRAYGLEFARALPGGREPFFLALNEAWQRELGSRALRL